MPSTLCCWQASKKHTRLKISLRPAVTRIRKISLKLYTTSARHFLLKWPCKKLTLLNAWHIVHPNNPCYENNYLFWMVDALNHSNRLRASLAVIVTMKYHWLKIHAFAKLFFEVGTEKSYSLSLLCSERCMEFCSVLFPCWLAYEFRKKAQRGPLI